MRVMRHETVRLILVMVTVIVTVIAVARSRSVCVGIGVALLRLVRAVCLLHRRERFLRAERGRAGE
jgi:hypothetical protein